MPLPAAFLMSEKNAIASVGWWLLNNVVQSGEKFVNQTYEQVQGPFPVFAYTQRPMPDLGAFAFDDYMGLGSLKDEQYGSVRQFMIEFNLVASLTDTVRNAQQYVYEMRERLFYGLYYAGQLLPNLTPIMPNIQLLNFDGIYWLVNNQIVNIVDNSQRWIAVNDAPATGGYLWWPSEESNTWMESPLLVDSADPQKKRLQIMVRFRYTAIRP